MKNHLLALQIHNAEDKGYGTDPCRGTMAVFNRSELTSEIKGVREVVQDR